MDTLSTPGWVWAMILGAAAAMAAGVPAGLRLALRSRDEWRQGGLVPASFAILGGWLVLTYVLAAAGVYRAGEERLPTILPAILGPILAGWFLVARSLRSAVEAVPQEALLAAQTPRVLGGVFLALAAMGALPPHFALPAGIGDVLVGALAPFVAWAYRSNPGRGRRLAVGFNLLGLADFALAVGIGFSAESLPAPADGAVHRADDRPASRAGPRLPRPPVRRDPPGIARRPAPDVVRGRPGDGGAPVAGRLPAALRASPRRHAACRAAVRYPRRGLLHCCPMRL